VVKRNLKFEKNWVLGNVELSRFDIDNRRSVSVENIHQFLADPWFPGLRLEKFAIRDATAPCPMFGGK
jgi:hypothetical protein